MKPGARLVAAIVTAAASGQLVPCCCGVRDDRERWTSEDADERALAAAECAACPAEVAEACQDFADAVHAMACVWAGVDYGERDVRRWRVAAGLAVSTRAEPATHPTSGQAPP